MPLSELEKKERKRISDKKYRENNREKKRLIDKKYKQTPEGKKKYRLNKWKFGGIIDPDIESVYDYFITQTHCWICDKEYNNNIIMDYRCLDHDHDLIDEPNIRYICCGYCNINVIR